MHVRTLVLAGLLLIPLPAAAATLQEYAVAILLFTNNTLVPLLFGLAFLFFLVNVARYFILGGGDEGKREKARSLALWGIIAFVLMVSIWGIVNLLVFGLGIGRTVPPCPDYLPASACPTGPRNFP